jgi:ATP-dependent Lon protease
LASLLLKRPVRRGLAMTGEITLRGSVMPVGGIKDKVLAAHRAGIESILLPKRNERDLHEVPADVRGALKIHFAETVDDVLQFAFESQAIATATTPNLDSVA